MYIILIMTKAQQLGIKEFPYEEKDESERITYWENEFGYWIRLGYDLKGNKVYHENSNGYGFVNIFDDNNKVISTIDIQTWKQIQHRNSVIDKLI